MGPRKAAALCEEAQKQIRDERLYMRWVCGGYQDKINFTEFKTMLERNVAPVQQPIGKEKTAEEILMKVKDILRKE